jgi:hypothetical protein
MVARLQRRAGLQKLAQAQAARRNMRLRLRKRRPPLSQSRSSSRRQVAMSASTKPAAQTEERGRAHNGCRPETSGTFGLLHREGPDDIELTGQSQRKPGHKTLRDAAGPSRISNPIAGGGVVADRPGSRSLVFAQPGETFPAFTAAVPPPGQQNRLISADSARISNSSDYGIDLISAGQRGG